MSILDENTALHDNSLRVTGLMKDNWISTSKWALFLAILGFINIGFSLLSIGSIKQTFETMAAFSGENMMMAMLAPMITYITVFSVLMLLVQFFLNFYHYRFASQIQRAVNFTDQHAFEDAWKNLRNHFRLFGIVVAVILAIGLIMLMIFWFYYRFGARL